MCFVIDFCLPTLSVTPEVSCESDMRISFKVDDVLLVCFDIDVRVLLFSGTPKVSCDSDKRFSFTLDDVLIFPG